MKILLFLLLTGCSTCIPCRSDYSPNRLEQHGKYTWVYDSKGELIWGEYP